MTRFVVSRGDSTTMGMCQDCNSWGARGGINGRTLAFGTRGRNLRLSTIMARYVVPTSSPSARTEGTSHASSSAQAPTSGRDALDRVTAERRLIDPGSQERNDVKVSGDGATPALSSSDGSTAPPAAPLLPSEYRGKSSGEFQRVSAVTAPDANSLIAEAEGYLLRLHPSDRNRRLLEVAILRRDTALLSGLLKVFRNQGS